ncbi:hypothetical protein VPNG_06223 [Cytospora leucostoma]|uniref:Uncharacterized protein n=1 Tax=Cytospora leucostoma TaxID=1230097 RepID=A0A423WYH5_9PEZI|nr:hypothetical protein VPNG_06223 [Cytospora leucostoma]
MSSKITSYFSKRPAAAAADVPVVAKKAKKAESSASAFEVESDEDWAPSLQSSEQVDSDGDETGEEGADDANVELELDPESDDLPPVAPLGVDDQVHRVLGCLNLDTIGTDLTPSDLLIKISALEDRHAVALAEFRDTCRQLKANERLGESLEPTDAFLDRYSAAGWGSHDRDIDDMWEELVEDVVKLGSGTIKPEYLVKPSGPLRAVLTCFWHYPTFKTRHQKFGHVFDRSNPSLRFQDDKIGANGWVRTQDRIPIRHKFVQGGVPWSEDFPNWEQIEKRCISFNEELMKYSKIMIFIGEENCATWRNFIHLAKDERITQVRFRSSVGDEAIKLPRHIYDQTPAFYTVRDGSGMVIRVVFLVYHSQYFIHSVDSRRGAYSDLIWNAALSLAELDIVRYDAFVRYTGTASMTAAITEAKTQGQADLSHMCYFVDFETNEACGKIRRNLGDLLRHWKAKHAASGVEWDYHLVTRVPHKEDLSEIQTLDSAKRSGRKPKSFDAPRFGCYHIDSETKALCTVSRTQLGVLRAHFLDKHKGNPWDPSKVKSIKQDEAQWEADIEQEAITAKEASIKANKRARHARYAVKTAATFKLQCLLCAYSNKVKHSNMKKHFESKHPTVEWIKGGKGCYKKVALDSEEAS